MMVFMSALSFYDSAKHMKDLSKWFLCLSMWLKGGMHLFFLLSSDGSKLPEFHKILQTWKLLLVTTISGQKVERKQYTQTEI